MRRVGLMGKCVLQAAGTGPKLTTSGPLAAVGAAGAVSSLLQLKQELKQDFGDDQDDRYGTRLAGGAVGQ